MHPILFQIPTATTLVSLSILYITLLCYLITLLSSRQNLLQNKTAKTAKQAKANVQQATFREGLGKTRQSLIPRLKALMGSGSPIDDAILEKVHETLFRSDIGVKTTDKIVAHLANNQEASKSWQTTLSVLRAKCRELVAPGAMGKLVYPDGEPLVILVVGVNGAGKTTTIGKLAHYFKSQGKSVLMAAGDTFRAAAADQLQVWAERVDAQIVRHKPGADPAAVCYDAINAAVSRKTDVVLVDTAGRLQNKQDLMNELAKIKRVMSKDLTSAPHYTWLVIDATTGQNAFSQLKSFSEVVPLNGLIVTKLDGTAKGGVMIGLIDEFQLPIRFVGLGEKVEDLRPFNGDEFIDSMFDEPS